MEPYSKVKMPGRDRLGQRSRRKAFIRQKRLLSLRLSKIPTPVQRMNFFNNFRANLPYGYRYGEGTSYDNSKLRRDVDITLAKLGISMKKLKAAQEGIIDDGPNRDRIITEFIDRIIVPVYMELRRKGHSHQELWT